MSTKNMRTNLYHEMDGITSKDLWIIETLTMAKCITLTDVTGSNPMNYHQMNMYFVGSSSLFDGGGYVI